MQRKLQFLGLSMDGRQRANRANHVWGWDFVENQTENGMRFWMLTLIDEHRLSAFLAGIGDSLGVPVNVLGLEMGDGTLIARSIGLRRARTAFKKSSDLPLN